MTSNNMPQIKRYELCNCVPNDGTTGGTAVLYSDHVAARAADKEEIERLQKNCTRWRRVADHHVNVTERFQARAEKAEARIAELDAEARSIGTVLADGYDSGTQVNADISLHYKSWEQAEKAFELLTGFIDAAINAAKPNPQGERRTE